MGTLLRVHDPAYEAGKVKLVLNTPLLGEEKERRSVPILRAESAKSIQPQRGQ